MQKPETLNNNNNNNSEGRILLFKDAVDKLESAVAGAIKSILISFDLKGRRVPVGWTRRPRGRPLAF